ncbi:glycosyltransferase family 4 protein [Dyella mobilis]|uniref:Glycosyltransferase family 4 protein n=2 Tax=Dyella mobilis TaxID=1849582 RepID=A0ABS2KFX4_9GAMM|nr:glycosyltransferase family 4 protein [Dyella mobilis]
MRILFISTSYPKDLKDWRGVFIRHVAGGLSRLEHVKLSIWAPPGELPPDVQSVTNISDDVWLSRLMAAGGISHLVRSGGVKAMSAPFVLLYRLRKAYERESHNDIYHINWLQCALPLPDDGKPAVITALGNDLKLLKLPLVRPLLRRVMKNRRVTICPNAEWMQAPLEAAFGDVARVRPISFGIDKCWYDIERQIDSSQPKPWLAVTRLTHDKLGPLFEWSEKIFQQTQRELHLFGPMQEQISIPSWVHYHGSASPDDLAAKWFPNACGLITLSRHAEGRPQVMLEAMASGLPIIASSMSAHASIVSHGSTGFLCESPQEYERAVERLEDPSTNRSFGHEARRWALQEFGTWDDCAGRYADIYRQLFENHSHA